MCSPCRPFSIREAEACNRDFVVPVLPTPIDAFSIFMLASSSIFESVYGRLCLAGLPRTLQAKEPHLQWKLGYWGDRLKEGDINAET